MLKSPESRKEVFAHAVNMLHDAIGKNMFPCACLEIGDRKGTILRYLEGNRSVYPRPEAADEDTLFDMASVTKILSTTMIALRFLEEGKICLSDTVGDYFDAPEDKKAITLLELMTHTSGIRPYTSITGICPYPDKITETILDLPLAFMPGEDVGYSCLGFILLGKILESIGGDSLDQLSRKYVFEKLDMKNTCFTPQGDNIASTDFNRKTGEYSKGIVNDRNARFLGGIAGNAGVFSSIGDMSKFAVMLANKGEYMGKHYLSPLVFDKALQNYTPRFNQTRGLGFILTDSKADSPAELLHPGSFGHTGYTGTSIVVDKATGLYIILLTNRLHADILNDGILRFRRQLHNTIAAAYAQMD